MLLAGTYTGILIPVVNMELIASSGGVLPLKVNDLRLTQLLKALFPILVTELGIVIEVRTKQFSKANSSIFVKEFGNSTERRAVQVSKARFPILIREFPIVTEVRLIH
jgi:hypothetical protein